MTGGVVCFGEVLLRFSAPGREQLLQSPHLDVCVGGAEANVAVSLARLGTAAEMVSVLPPDALGRSSRDELRRHGVGVSGIEWLPGRMGLYFLTHGSMFRPSEVLYDRAGSAFETAPSDLFDWGPLLAGAGRLHLSGVTPALGPESAAAALRAAQAAQDSGVPISIDGNYRAKLWERWNGDSASILHNLFAYADIAFADERDISLILGKQFEGTREQQLAQAAEAAFSAFPKLQRIACTRRIQHSVDHHDLTATMTDRRGTIGTRSYDLTAIIDRVGAGDAFVAGIIHSLLKGRTDQEALDFGLAAAALKHSILGDFNLIGEQDVQALLSEEGLHIRR